LKTEQYDNGTKKPFRGSDLKNISKQDMDDGMCA